MPKLRIVGEAEVRSLTTVADALAIVEETYREFGRTGSQGLSDPPSLFAGSKRPGHAAFKVKGATLAGVGVTGLRLIADAPPGEGGRTYDFCYVLDDRTGEPLGLVEETWLHALRTALTGVVAAKALARPDSRIAAVIGAGKIAAELFPALTQTFRLAEVRVAARRRESARAFALGHGAATGVPFRAAADAAEAIAGADIVITLTTADQPFVKPGMLKAGAFLCSMGEGEEVDHAVLDEVDRFVVDDFEYATRLGDIAAWIRKGRAPREALAARVDSEIGAICAGRAPGRQDPGERIYAVIQGMAICDLALANWVLGRARARGLGSEAEVFAPGAPG
ncbi:MAG: ornithine cyclodeaminase family protein [Proteobacteria bacterium]|nr:ornithine cyclodeaminase family protein [Pseudomonadota bacterium]